MIKLTEDIVANSLWRWREKGGHLTACSRSSLHYCESDLLSVRSMLSYDHEIKLTRADYLNEFRKATKRFKHSKIAEAFNPIGKWNKYAPNFYTFVTPKDMLRKGDPIPHYAGIIEFELADKSYYYDDEGSTLKQIVFTVRRKAPRIHSVPLTDKHIARLARALSFRLFNARARLDGGYY